MPEEENPEDGLEEINDDPKRPNIVDSVNDLKKKNESNIRDAAKLTENIATANWVGATINAAKLAWRNRDKVVLFFQVSIFIILILGILGATVLAGTIEGSWAGGNGLSNQVVIGPQNSKTKELLDLNKENAKVNGQAVKVRENSTGGLGGIGIGGNFKGIPKIKFAPRDLEFLNNIYNKGSDPRRGTKLDRRLVEALKYLSDKHDYIFVSHIVNTYEDMKVDRENSSKPQVLANISAHVSGQALDIREIDFVFKGIDPKPTCGVEDPRRDIVWFSKHESGMKEVYRQRCKATIFQMATLIGGPVISGMPTEAIPIKVAWQDDPPKLSKSTRGSFRATGERLLERELKLPPGALDESINQDIFTRTGMAELAQRFGLEADQIIGSTSGEIYENLGRSQLEDKLGLERGSLNGNELGEIVKNTGESYLEDMFELPVGSWQGTNIESLAQSIGQSTLEKELGLPSGTLADPNKTAANLKEKIVTAEDLQKIAISFRIPPELMTQLYDGIQAGRIETDPLVKLGSRRLERAWEIAEGTLDTYIENAKKELPLVLPDITINSEFDWQTLSKNMPFALPEGDITTFINKLAKGENVGETVKIFGKQNLETALGLKEGILDKLIGGLPVDMDDVIIKENFDGDVKSLISTFASKGNLGDYWQKTGKDLFSKKLLENPEALTLRINNNLLDLVSNDPLAGAKEIGRQIFKQNLDLSDEQLSKIMIKSGFEDLDILKSIDKSFDWSDGTFGNILSGQSKAGDLIGLGASIGGSGLLPFGGGEAQVMKNVFRPEARYKVHQVITELLNITKETNNLNLLVIQLITFSQERDVAPFAELLDRLYGDSRKGNYGLFSMPEAHPNIHIGY